MGKSVEYWFSPDETHELFEVRRRIRCNQLLVDWFRFWLKGEEDADPAKQEQYARWRQFRDARASIHDLESAPALPRRAPPD